MLITPLLVPKSTGIACGESQRTTRRSRHAGSPWKVTYPKGKKSSNHPLSNFRDVMSFWKDPDLQRNLIICSESIHYIWLYNNSLFLSLPSIMHPRTSKILDFGRMCFFAERRTWASLGEEPRGKDRGRPILGDSKLILMDFPGSGRFPHPQNWNTGEFLHRFHSGQQPCVDPWNLKGIYGMQFWTVYHGHVW